MAKLINGNGNPAVYAAEDSDWFAAIMGNTTAITAIGEQFRADQADANTIEVFDGVIITQEGRRIQLDVDDVDLFDIPTGTPGDTSYYIIGYHLVTDTDSNQSCETFVQKMDDGSETIPENTFRGGADEVYISLYRVTQTGLNITGIDLLLPYIGTIGDLKSIPEYTVCTTAASTAAKTATIDGFELVEGAKVTVNFAYKNTATTPTLNISGTGAKEIRKRTGTSTFITYKNIPYGPVDLVYDGTYWLAQEGGGGMQKNYYFMGAGNGSSYPFYVDISELQDTDTITVSCLNGNAIKTELITISTAKTYSSDNPHRMMPATNVYGNIEYSNGKLKFYASTGYPIYWNINLNV